jgi:hypothetical protein
MISLSTYRIFVTQVHDWKVIVLQYSLAILTSAFKSCQHKIHRVSSEPNKSTEMSCKRNSLLLIHFPCSYESITSVQKTPFNKGES